MAEEKFFVYILQSMKDFSFYTGQCDDLDRRMSKHADGFSKYTKAKRPWRLRYFEGLPSRTHALKREKQLKAWKNKLRYMELITKWPTKWETCSSG